MTPDSQQQKYAQMVVSTGIATGCVQFLGEENRFRTAWTLTGHAAKSRNEVSGARSLDQLVGKNSLIFASS